jgi:hypothetical protein
LGYDAISVNEIFGQDPRNDDPIRECADEWGARVVASDRGRDPGGGFGSRIIRVDGRVRTVEQVIRIVQAAI